MNRPVLAAHEMKTFAIQAPLGDDHGYWRPATCEEVECPGWRGQMAAQIDESSTLGQGQAHYIRHDGSRPKPTETRLESGLTQFAYPAGTTCFRSAEHRARVEKQELFIVRGGDRRGNPRGEVKRHATAADWVDEFAENQQTLADAQRRG